VLNRVATINTFSKRYVVFENRNGKKVLRNLACRKGSCSAAYIYSAVLHVSKASIRTSTFIILLGQSSGKERTEDEPPVLRPSPPSFGFTSVNSSTLLDAQYNCAQTYKIHTVRAREGEGHVQQSVHNIISVVQNIINSQYLEYAGKRKRNSRQLFATSRYSTSQWPGPSFCRRPPNNTKQQQQVRQLPRQYSLLTTMTSLINFAVVTIFVREVLEGAIIIGEYRTIIVRSDRGCLKAGIQKDEALREVTLSALFATALALLVIAAVAIPLAVLSRSFDPATSKIIEGVSKIVAAISLLQLSLKLPRFLGVYGSAKKKNKDVRRKATRDTEEDDEDEEEEQREEDSCVDGEASDADAEDPEAAGGDGSEAAGDYGCSGSANDGDADNEDAVDDDGSDDDGMTLSSIRFNVAWNIWREVAECGVFLIPFFLSGEDLEAIPLSALIGAVVGMALGVGIYYANKRFTNKLGLTVFAVLLLVVLSAGLFTGGCHNLEGEIGTTRQVWQIDGDFWSVDRLPMTILKPFGYDDTRTVLQIVCFWSWLAFAALLHFRKYWISPKITQGQAVPEARPALERVLSDASSFSKSSKGFDTVEMGDSSLEGENVSRENSFLGDDGSIRFPVPPSTGRTIPRQVDEKSLEVSFDGVIRSHESSSFDDPVVSTTVDRLNSTNDEQSRKPALSPGRERLSM